jgi:prephenate dehydrogenase
VAIVGVGLIGGSIGLALQKLKLARKVIGIGRRQVSLRIARRVGAVTNTTIDLTKGVVDAELVIVATPVGRIVEDVKRAAEYAPEGTLITDVGSTKQTIVEALDSGLPRGCRFLGGHPLAGSEKAGASNAASDLFDGCLALLTPTVNTKAEDFDLLTRLWEAMGSVVVKMAPDEHDKVLAMTSHLPHLAASALAATVPETYFRFAGSGMKDTSRLAAGDPELWRQIISLNREHILTVLEQYGGKLAALHAAIRDCNDDMLIQFLTTAKKNRDALGS